MGIIDFILDIYENTRRSKKEGSNKKYDGDASEFTGNKKEDLKRIEQIVATEIPSAKNSSKRKYEEKKRDER